MAFCRNCGTELQDGQKFCGNCGTPVDNFENKENTNNEYQGSYEEAPKYEPISEEIFAPAPTGKLSVGMLIWAILNTVFSVCTCCLPIGVLPLVFAILTNNVDAEVSKKRRKIALICNIVVTALIVIAFVASMVITVVFAEEIDRLLVEYGYYDVSLNY